MPKKTTLLILLVFLFSFSIFLYSKTLEEDPLINSEKEFELEEIIITEEDFLNALKDETGIGFSGIEEASLVWVFPAKSQEESGEAVNLSAKKIQVSSVLKEDFEKVEDFFRNRFFTFDINNSFFSDISESNAYYSKNLVCLLINRALKDQLSLDDPERRDVEVRCAESSFYKDSAESINNMEISEGDFFNIYLSSSLKEGYTWEADFDSNFLKMEDHEHDEPFTFFGLKKGKTTVIFNYFKDGNLIDREIYRVLIK